MNTEINNSVENTDLSHGFNGANKTNDLLGNLNDVVTQCSSVIGGLNIDIDVDQLKSALSETKIKDPAEFLENNKELLLGYIEKGLSINCRNVLAFASIKLSDNDVAKLVKFQGLGIEVSTLSDITILLSAFLRCTSVIEGLNIDIDSCQLYDALRETEIEDPAEFLENNRELLLGYIEKGLSINCRNVLAFASINLSDNDVVKLVKFQKFGSKVNTLSDITTLLSREKVSIGDVRNLGFKNSVLDSIGELGLDDRSINCRCLFAELIGIEFENVYYLCENFDKLFKDKVGSEFSYFSESISKINLEFLQQLIDLFGTINFDAFKCLISLNDHNEMILENKKFDEIVFDYLLKAKRDGYLKKAIQETYKINKDNDKILKRHADAMKKIDDNVFNNPEAKKDDPEYKASQQNYSSLEVSIEILQQLSDSVAIFGIISDNIDLFFDKK